MRDELRSLLGESLPLAGASYHWANSSWPIRALHELAESEDVELIVLGAAQVRLKRHVSAMERAVHGAPCAVAVAPAGYAESTEHGLGSIGVGFADTEEVMRRSHWRVP